MNMEIRGTGCCIPAKKVENSAFIKNHFFTDKGESITAPGEEIIRKFSEITGIAERRYAADHQNTSDLATVASREALLDAQLDAERLNGLIVAHNFGDVTHEGMHSDILPCLASRVKQNLGIRNPNCVAFDLLYGCPGWIQGLITAGAYIEAGIGRRYLVVGAETLSRKLDPHDRDAMIFSDGAGACVLQAKENTQSTHGVLSAVSQTYTEEEAYYLFYGESNNPDYEVNRRFVKMHGRKIFEFALSKVPAALKDCLDQAGLDLSEVDKILIHQANEKMDEAIIKRLYRLYGQTPPKDIMPMSIKELGNSSVATVPTLLDMIRKNQFPPHRYEKGDVVLMASVGSGMSINAMAYRV